MLGPISLECAVTEQFLSAQNRFICKQKFWILNHLPSCAWNLYLLLPFRRTVGPGWMHGRVSCRNCGCYWGRARVVVPELSTPISYHFSVAFRRKSSDRTLLSTRSSSATWRKGKLHAFWVADLCTLRILPYLLRISTQNTEIRDMLIRLRKLSSPRFILYRSFLC